MDTPWLASRQIDYKLAHWYVKSGWMRSVAKGVYQRPEVAKEQSDLPVDWLAVVASIQNLMGYDVHIGGKTALSLHGHQHYLKFGQKEPVYLYGDGPPWLKRVSSNQKFTARTRLMFQQSDLGVKETTDLPIFRGIGAFRAQETDLWAIRLSLPERAILEMIAELPKRESFELVDRAFESLVSLRPDLLQELLVTCSNVKVKRYFMVFADRHNHSWRAYISPENVNLGSGPRQTFGGGRIHPKYLISVPASFIEAENRDYQDGP